MNSFTSKAVQSMASMAGLTTKMNAAKLQQVLFQSAGLPFSGGSASVQCRAASTHSTSKRNNSNYTHPANFKMKRALVLTKISRYEFERNRHSDLSDSEIESLLRKRGSDFSVMRRHHAVHKAAEQRLLSALQAKGVETEVCKRQEFTDEKVKWADVVFTAGGDGTFLMGASKILNDRKPIIGLNTDPTRSEGYLCLPKHYSDHIEDAVDKVAKGAFYWFLRKRLRITLIGDHHNIREAALELHQQELQYPEYRYVELINESEVGDHPLGGEKQNGGDEPVLSKRIIPILALNEVFVGESLSSRVSYLEIEFDDDPTPVKTRNSGLCISTGTGSTSWTFNINKLTHQSVESLLRIVSDTTPHSLDWHDPGLIERVTQSFNNEIIFNPEKSMMAYTLRDPVSAGTFPGARERRPRGLANRIMVKSRCFDACLVIDGSLSFKFNDGTKAIVEIHENDALRTVELEEGDHQRTP